MTEPIFLPAPLFFLRVPRLARESSDRLLKEADWRGAIWDFYEKSPLLQEAVLIGSPSLFHAIEKGKRTEELAASLLKYALRMGTRATPYGLFSFIASGRWGEKDERLDLAKVVKRARPDMSWAFSLIQKRYEDEALFPTLLVQTNCLIKMNGERCFLSFIRYAAKEDERNDHTFSIRKGPLMEAIFELAKEPKEVDALCEELLEMNPALKKEKLIGTLRQLVEKQFLLPGILPSMFSLTPFESGLEWVETGIKSYESLPLGKGVAAFQELEKRLLEVSAAKTGLQVDIVYRGAPLALPELVAKELSDAASMIWKLSPRKSMGSAIALYHEKFIEKYGTDRTVPLLELLNEEKGLGPLKQEESVNRGQIPFKLRWEKWLHMEWEKCLRDGRGEIVLPEGLDSHLYELCGEKPTDPSDALVSIDLFCKIAARSKEEIEAGNFLIELVQPSWHGGSAIGRFLYLVEEEERDMMREYFSQEEALEKGTHFVEMSGWPKTGYNANVASYPALRKYRLELQGKGDFSLEDIYVGSSGDRLYLTEKEGGAEIVFRVCNFVNANLTAAPLQFMREVSLTRFQLFHPFSWGPLDGKSSFLPRVRYKKALLSLARWNLDSSIFEKKETLEEQFLAWADQWKVPKQCLLMHLDQYLLVDLSHPASLKEIVLKIKKGEILQFVEELPQEWLKSEEGSHSAELVFPMLKNPIYAKKPPFVPLAHEEVAFSDRLRLPGDEWLYLKVYLEADEANRFLMEHVALFKQELFFVRYRDSGFHLRLRFKMDPSLLEEVREKVAYWIEAGVIQNALWTPYEREIERYGGMELIGLAEALFCEDSRNVLEELQDSEGDVISHAISGLKFLRRFGLDAPQMIALLQMSVKGTEGLSGFREHKGQLMALAEAVLLREEASGAKSAFSMQSYNSMLHMHYNRLGSNRREEDSARLYILHTLLQLEKRAAKFAAL